MANSTQALYPKKSRVYDKLATQCLIEQERMNQLRIAFGLHFTPAVARLQSTTIYLSPEAEKDTRSDDDMRALLDEIISARRALQAECRERAEEKRDRAKRPRNSALDVLSGNAK